MGRVAAPPPLAEAPPRIGITLGDPAGIGPEVVLAALADPRLAGGRWVIYGDRSILERAHATLREAGARLPGIDPRAIPHPDVLEVVEVTSALADEVRPGTPALAAGRAELAYLQAGTLAALRGEIAGLATAPFSKALADEAVGFPYPGQTEYLAAACAQHGARTTATDPASAGEPVMLMAGPRLRVALATTHMALAEVPAAIRGGAVARTLGVLARALKDDFGLGAPRIGVCALNPHAGERGRFGREDDEAVQPQVAAVRAELEREGRRVLIEGPLPADTLFAAALAPRPDGATRRRFDAVLALYHDQGLGPAKVLDFDRTVNVTLGLPLVRTAPDHGVAYDLAGTAQARPQAMAEALWLAAELVRARRARELTGAGREG